MKKSSCRRRKIKVRRFWTIKPATKVKKSARIYKRKREKKTLKDLMKDYL